MLNKRRITIIALVSLLMTGCAIPPSQVGIPEQEWSAMSPAQRQSVVRGYREMQLVNLGGSVINRQGNQAKAAGGISVRISGGTAVLGPDFRRGSYNPVYFALQPGQCEAVLIRGDVFGQRSLMRACYLDQELLLDPSPYDISKRLASVRFRATPMWTRGQTYRGVSTSGYIRFRQADIGVAKAKV